MREADTDNIPATECSGQPGDTTEVTPGIDLTGLFCPRSIVVIGATERPSISSTVIRSLHCLGYGGKIIPVNRKYESVLGHRCFPDIDSIDGDIDLVLHCLGQRHALGQLERAAARGARAAVIYDGGFAESGADGARQQQDLAALCREAGIALCGPNCMGFSSPHTRVHCYMLAVEDAESLTGNVGLISQSGSVCIGITTDTRRYGFSRVISTGNEAVVSNAAFLEHLIADPFTRVVGMFIESVTEPERFIAALDAAAAAGKPVVVLKVGRTERAAAAVSTHTGGLAGEARVFSALLKAHRAIEAETIEDMCEVFAACQGEHIPAVSRLGVITSSGGHAELMLDLAEHAGVELPPLAPDLRERVWSVVGVSTGDGNPLDAWGNGDYRTNYPPALEALRKSPDHDAIVMTLDDFDQKPMDHGELSKDCAAMMRESRAGSNKPHFILSTLCGVFNAGHVPRFQQGDVAVLSGIQPAFRALGKLARAASPRSDERPIKPPMAVDEWVTSAARSTVHEYDAKRLLADYGLTVPAEKQAQSVADAIAAANELGYPVVLKALSDDLGHRTEHGLVRLGLNDDEQLAGALRDMQARIGETNIAGDGVSWLVQTMLSPGVEVIAGVTRDPAFGHVLVVGPGGILAEAMDEVSLRPLPLREGDVEAMLEETRLSTQLAGVRGRPPADRPALIKAVESIADFATANRPWIESIDVNPIIVHAHGCVAADALIVPHQQEGKP